jgi:hypothetical protein
MDQDNKVHCLKFVPTAHGSFDESVEQGRFLLQSAAIGVSAQPQSRQLNFIYWVRYLQEIRTDKHQYGSCA